MLSVIVRIELSCILHSHAAQALALEKLGKGEVLLNGKMAKFIGNVCMDMIMVDVTNIECKEGDEVIIFDDSSYSAEDFAEKANTISYELISSLSRRIKRFVK